MEIGGNRSMNEFLDSKDQKEKKKKNVLVIMKWVRAKNFFFFFSPPRYLNFLQRWDE